MSPVETNSRGHALQAGKPIACGSVCLLGDTPRNRDDVLTPAHERPCAKAQNGSRLACLVGVRCPFLQIRWPNRVCRILQSDGRYHNLSQPLSWRSGFVFRPIASIGLPIARRG